MNGTGNKLPYPDKTNPVLHNFTIDGMNIGYTGDGYSSTPFNPTERLTIDNVTEDLIVIISGQGYFDITANWTTIRAGDAAGADAGRRPHAAGRSGPAECGRRHAHVYQDAGAGPERHRAHQRRHCPQGSDPLPPRRGAEQAGKYRRQPQYSGRKPASRRIPHFRRGRGHGNDDIHSQSDTLANGHGHALAGQLLPAYAHAADRGIGRNAAGQRVAPS